MTRTLTRFEALSADLTLLRAAGPLERLLLMPARLDTEIGRRAMQDFQPALPASFLGVGFAAIGFLAGYGLLAALAGLLARLLRRRQMV